MPRILVLAQSGFGKTTSIGPVPKLGIKGLDPKKTFLISCNQKALSIPGWKKLYSPIDSKALTGNHLVTSNAATIIKAIDHVVASRPDLEIICIDDINYIMQDYYMDHAKNKGYDVFKNIGYDFSQVQRALDKAHANNRVIIAMGHYEIDDTGGIIQVRLKTAGKMVNQYMTPEGKFDTMLIGVSDFDETTKKVSKRYLTGYDGRLEAKAPPGMFDELFIPNDLGLVVETALQYELDN